MSVLELAGLTVAYGTTASRKTVVQDASLTLEAGTILGLAGESGCGKSTTALAMMGYPIPGAHVLNGQSVMGGADLLRLSPQDLRAVWGKHIAYVPPDAGLSLNPAWRIQSLMAEPLHRHLGLHDRQIESRMEQLIDDVGLPTAMLHRYPHELSGGQQQRVSLAIAVACHPKVLILDEPTSGLDVTTQAQICTLIRRMVKSAQIAALYISHDLAMLETIVDDMLVMYGGQIVERSSGRAVFVSPRHPYTAALMQAIPNIDGNRSVRGIPGMPPSSVVQDRCAFAPRCDFVQPVCTAAPVPLLPISQDAQVRCARVDQIRLQADHDGGPTLASRGTEQAPTAAPTNPVLALDALICEHRSRRSVIQAVREVTLELHQGEILGIVGESGSGKSTLLRAIVGLHAPRSGEIKYFGQSVGRRVSQRPRALRKSIQIVFQNPDDSLNPRQSVQQILGRPIRVFEPGLTRAERHALIYDTISRSRLTDNILGSYPHELSSGQRQRVALARALIAHPKVLLCDEVVSALDVSVQAAILQLILELRRQGQLSILFVTHNLGVARTICDRIGVMKDGRIEEIGKTEDVIRRPQRAYTKQLLSAVPRLHAEGTMKE